MAGRTVLAVASFGALLAFLDATIVNVAFPSIQASFPEASIATISWVLNGYNIVLAAAMIVCGRLCDLLGRRRLYIAGVALFTVASVWCAAAWSVELLVLGRLVQGLGAAMLIPASLGLVIEAFPASERHHAVGLWGAAAAVAAGLGPPVGGVLVELGGWRWAFLVNIPLGVAAIALGRRVLVESRSPGIRQLPDLVGAGLLAGAMGLGTTLIIKAGDWGWASATSWLVALGTVALVVGFAVSSRRHRSPLLDGAMLRSRPFVVANVVTIVAGLGFFAYMLTNILWLQYVWRYSVIEAGLALMPAAFVAAVVAAVMGPIAARRGYRLIVMVGAVVWSLAYVWYITRVGTTPAFLSQWLPGQVLSGIGVGMCLPLLGSAAMASLPGGRFGTASAVVSSARQTGGVLGIAVLVAVLGTPTPENAVTVLRDGWWISVVAFAACAVLVAFLGRISEEEDDAQEAEAATGRVHVPVGDSGSVSRSIAPQRPGLFASLPLQTQEALRASAVPRRVPAGQWLVREGEHATSMLVLTAGRADVVIGDTVVRDLGPGSLIGELALITGGLRSASVRARRDCRVLEVSKAVWDEAVGTSAEALSACIGTLAAQLADPRPPSTLPTRPRVLAVVAASTTAPTREVAEHLRAALGTVYSVDVCTDLSPEQLDMAERHHDRVVLVAPESNAWAEYSARSADLVVLVARVGEPIVTPTPGALRPELVLVGAPATTEQLATWTRAVDPWRVTQTPDGRLASGLRGLCDRVVGRSVGIVLSGGGARALTHLGVLAELEDAGIVIDRVAGASVGAVIGSLYASGMTAGEVEEVMYRSFVRAKPFADYTLPRNALARGQRIRRAAEDQFGETLIESLPRGFCCVSTDMLKRSVVVHRTGSVADAIRASAALPVLLPPVRTEDRLLVDGGILDNLPVHTLTERDEGPVIAVNIGTGGAGGPGAVGSAGQATVRRTIRVPSLGETLFRTMMISGGDHSSAVGTGAYVISPSSMGVGLLEFHQIDRMIASGRAAARRLLDETGGTFQPAGPEQ
ncbi:hypothetical protein N801_07020 [Knoellia aerolata DSM 18566]|uniref:MFS transporter n=1 Tax=Knoellia aerolata DSM 18566 TaxID=1385519 RepID=A0A0A0K1A9_9MICO|nr:hypothetical protein N801_07020 [Knoellia aerolata DSM 18566]